MNIGYACNSAGEPFLNLQRDALTAAGCESLFTDTLSGAKTSRSMVLAAQALYRPRSPFDRWRRFMRYSRLTKSRLSGLDALLPFRAC